MIERIKANEAHHGFIKTSWLRSLRDLSPYHRLIGIDQFYAGQLKIINWVLANAAIDLLVPDDDHDTVLAWLARNDGVVHYVLTRHSMQRCGLAKQLWAPLVDHKIVYTHSTLWGGRLPKPWIFDPYFYQNVL